MFRAGDIVLDNEQIARQAWLEPDVLDRMLPMIVQSGFMARDDDGALFSPHLYERELRREERAYRRAMAVENRQAIERGIAEGSLPPTMTPQQAANASNGARGGRPRKGETAEQAKARREREMHQAQQQRKMPLMSAMSGGKTGTQNPNTKTHSVSVSVSGEDNSVSGFPIDLDIECDNNIPSSSTSVETENPKTETETEKSAYEQADAQRLAARMMAASGLGEDQAGFAMSFAKQYLGRGISPDLIVEAIAAHKQKMAKNFDAPKGFGVFKAPVERAVAGEEIAQIVSEQGAVQRDIPEWQQIMEAAYEKAGSLYGKTMQELGDFGRMTREWPIIAERNGLPPIAWTRSAYESHFHPDKQQKAA
ncbi:hypothetical protein [Acetobacter tropicalis]|uniref:hypothetical protein n=1 Tax=Acetobacter tropicalis TaxID=104102 RepID=UPI00165697C4|nr:hypothetical protein [Acetobacter tropicalis]MBC9008771.1 hypothetical protein [Acetobacter tropicalis]